MSSNTPTPQSQSAWSSFATFEMPTTDIVLELPPLGATDLNPPVAEESEVEPQVEVAEVTEAEEVAEIAAEEVQPETVVEERVAEIVEPEVVADEVVAEATDDSDVVEESFIDVRSQQVPQADEDIPDVEEAFADVLKRPEPIAKKSEPQVKAVESAVKPAEPKHTEPKISEPVARVTAESVIDRIRQKQQSGADAQTSAVEPEPVPAMAAPAVVAAPVAAPVAAVAPAPVAPKIAAPPVVTAPVAVAPKSPAPVAPAPPKTVVVEDGEPGQIRFRDLPLREEVQRAIERSGYDKPTEIQAQIIPYMLDGRDVLAQSQTGTGKTAAFALPILTRIDIDNHSPQVLVLAPTRELAIQVGRSFATYAADIPGFSVATIYGGADYDTQLRALRNGAQVVVGTPGRTIDHINRGTLKLDGITCLALDEADEMLNMGFLEDVEYVLERTPDGRQIALFSATMPAPIRNIAQRYLNNPARITVKTKTMTAESIRQRALIVSPRDKVDTLIRFLEVEEADGVIVFTKTREATVSVAEALCQHGLSAIALNGDIPQKLRERTIEQLKSGKLDILVATDVAARGLDVQRVSHVFNYDVPNDSESYIHRIGRTGRAGRKGEAIIFLSNSQRYKLRSIERVTKQPIEVVQAPTADDMNAMRVVRFKQQITDVMADQDLAMFHKMITEYAAETGNPIEYIAAALAHLGQNGRPFFVEDRPRRKSFERDDQRPMNGRNDRGDRGDRRPDRGRGGSEDRFGGAPRQLSAPRAGMERFRIEVGSKDGVKPGNIVGAVANEGGLDGDQIGPISIHPNHSTVDLPTGMPADIYQTLQQTWVAGKQLQLTRDSGERHSESSGGGGAHRSGGGSRPAHAGGARKSFPPRSGGPGGAGAKFKKRKPRTRPRD